MIHPSECGPCVDCVEALTDCASVRVYEERVAATWWEREFPTAPTEAALRRHASRYGRECVADVARAYGMDGLALELAESPGGPRRATTDTMREQVRALAERGLVPAAIADVLNLKDGRVRRLLREMA